MGAALAYYTLLSLMPLLLVLTSVAGLVFGANDAQAKVLNQLHFLIGAQRTGILQALLRGASSRTEGVVATITGLVILLFGASGVLVELRDALNTVWEVPIRALGTMQEFTSIAKERLWSLVVVLVAVLVLTASLLFGASISAFSQLTTALPASATILHLFNVGISLIALTLVFAAIYKVVPEVPLQWLDVIVGALVTAILFTIGNFLLSWYLGKVSFSSTYGAASSTVVLAIWAYYSSQVFLLGAEFTKTFAATYGSAPRQKRNRTSH